MIGTNLRIEIVSDPPRFLRFVRNIGLAGGPRGNTFDPPRVLRSGTGFLGTAWIWAFSRVGLGQ